MFIFQILCIRKGETVSYLQYVYVLGFVYQKEGNCITPTICLCSRFCVSERRKLHHIYNMFMFQILCIRKRETISHLQICLCSRFWVSERGELFHTLRMCMIQTLYIRKKETVSFIQYDYDLDFVYQKQENCIIPTVCL